MVSIVVITGNLTTWRNEQNTNKENVLFTLVSRTNSKFSVIISFIYFILTCRGELCVLTEQITTANTDGL